MSLLKEFSVQLWSVRDETEKDFAGTLKKLAQMGYTGVEFAGYGGLSAQEMKDVLVSNSLKPVGAHIGLDRLTNALDEEIAYHKIIGTEYLICPSSKIKTSEDAKTLAETFKPVIAKITEAGFKFAYHNHAFEFNKCCGDYLLDTLFATLPQEAAMELDIFWVSFAGVDPLVYMEKHRDRLKLIHVKQIDKDKKCVDIDQGILDYKEIITKAKAFGVQQFILEQEEYAVSSMVSVKNDIDYIFKL
ncbi:MAG: sugar phosphate isomerase/epimerase [Treponema sp.]|nr:sugar phosphate isomerase/epimerase [Treponema sp.]MCL2271386.1 sugar phosphate isomerase/epimerase [Treponema sp.]